MRSLVLFALFSVVVNALQTRLHAVTVRRCSAPLRSEPEAPAAPTAPTGIKALLAADMKAAMKSKDKEKLAGVRAIQTAIKQREVTILYTTSAPPTAPTSSPSAPIC